ncbi:MAG: BNR-4 repeat-containing protein, partial [Candidatus Aenigmarchaeota archaeon]|nr:BNR-4 repeat-containing protein [Candidatus Aenigmarchaeota archaeon]
MMKKSVLSLLVFLYMISVVFGSDPTTALQLHFDETTAPLMDTSGNALTVTSVGGVVLGVDGKTGKAIELNGYDGYVDVGDALNGVTVPFTIAAWIYPTENGGGIITSDDPSTDTGNYYGFSFDVDMPPNSFRPILFGTSSDVPVPADYNGDGKTDLATFRPSTGKWYIDFNADGIAEQEVAYGSGSDIKIPADYNGDGKADLALFRPSTRYWFIDFNADRTSDIAVTYGLATDKLVPADYNGDKKADLAVFRPSNGRWYIDFNADGLVDQEVAYGLATDKPVPADYNGDGKADLALFRPSTGEWLVDTNLDGHQDIVVKYGLATDKPVPADYNGDGKTDLAVFRPSNGRWYIDLDQNGRSDLSVASGLASDVLVPADYNGDKKADLAVFRPSDGKWRIDTNRDGTTDDPMILRNHLRITYGDGHAADGTGRRTKTSDATIPLNTWTHVAAVVRGPTDMSLYVNGQEVSGTYDGTGGTMVHNADPARVGIRTRYGRSGALLQGPIFFKGAIDELTVWNQNLINPGILSLTLIDTNARDINAVPFTTPIASLNNELYVCYVNGNLDLIVAKSSDNGKTWQKNIVYSGNTDNSHNTCSIGVDKNGYIHVSYDMHATPLHYKISDNPNDISSFTAKTMTGTEENKATYPQFIKDPAGELYFFYRSGVSGGGDLVIKKYNTATKQWSDLFVPLINGRSLTPQDNAYYNNVAFDSQNRMHLSWEYRQEGQDFNLSYAVYEINSGKWKKTDGTVYTLPISRLTSETAQKIEKRERFRYMGGIALDSLDRPHVSFVKDAPDGKQEIFHTFYNGGAWETTQVTNMNYPDVFDLKRPQIVIDSSDTVYIFFTNKTAPSSVGDPSTVIDPGVLFLVKSTDYGKTWSTPEPIFLPNSQLGGEFTLDYSYLRETGKTRFFFQTMNQRNGPLYLLEINFALLGNVGTAKPIVTTSDIPVTAPSPQRTSDKTPPTVTITGPRTSQRVTTSQITVSGTASDQSGIAKVEVKVG